MASILLSSTVEQDMTQENKTSTDKLHLTNELFYNTTVSYPFTWILTVLVILAGRKYNSAKYYFFRSHKLQSKCLPKGMNIFMYFKHLLCFL